MAPDRTPIRAAIFASGSGTNAENILDFCKNEAKRIQIALVVTNRADAGVIQRAKNYNVPCAVLPVQREQYPTYAAARAAQEAGVLEMLAAQKIDWLFLAGYIQLLSPAFLKPFADEMLGINRIVNIHPSLLPAFPGKNSYKQAYDAGVETAGVTLHFVDDGMDTGPIIAQSSFSRGALDFDAFCAAGMKLEYAAYRQFLRALDAGTLALPKHKEDAHAKRRQN